MKTVRILFCLAVLFSQAKAGENFHKVSLESECKDSSSSPIKALPLVACSQGTPYRIKYDEKTRKIKLIYNHKNMALEQFSKGRDPALVGADSIIGFLPDQLQVYKNTGVLLYISSIRTNSGSGGGQCGAGSEIYLNFLAVKKPKPRVSSRILVGSCDYSIELDNQNIQDGEIGEISVEDGQLRLHFLHYKNLGGSPVATITPDRKSLVFN
jgi:hypothetical protein